MYYVIYYVTLKMLPNTARHKTNANYGNLVFDKVDREKNVFYDSSLTIELD